MGKPVQPAPPKGAKTQKVSDFLKGNFACSMVMRQRDCEPREYPMIMSDKVLETIKDWQGMYIDSFTGVLLDKDTLEIKFHNSAGVATIITITFLSTI